MTITLKWEDEKRSILRYDFFGHWTTDELEQRMTEAAAMMDTVAHPINIFVNVRGMNFIPVLSLQTLRTIAKAPTTRHHNFGGTVVVIGANTFVRTLFDTFARIAPQVAQLYHFVDTVTDAHQIVD